MKLSLSLAKKLLILVQDKSINNSEFKNASKLQELIEFGIVELRVKGQKTKIGLLSQDKLQKYLKHHFGINDLQSYIDEGLNPNRSRASIASQSNDTKSFKTQVQGGFYMSSYEPIEILVNEEKITLLTPDMTSMFIHKRAKIKIPNDVLIVGVENFENLNSICKQKHLFKDPRKKMFIYRNKYLNDLLSKSFNDYLHFGDFDLAGINIFLNEIIPRLAHERHTFYIPENIEELLGYGNADDYFTQNKKYPNLKTKLKYLQDLINLIHKKKRSLHQEYLINI
ncbi:MAG: hypothetical protein COA44_14785 [Arcobacter sp.]|nr:MAG: hypothetical protein COA44_14785 [Arcobacter sp.]